MDEQDPFRSIFDSLGHHLAERGTVVIKGRIDFVAGIQAGLNLARKLDVIVSVRATSQRSVLAPQVAEVERAKQHRRNVAMRLQREPGV